MTPLCRHAISCCLLLGGCHDWASLSAFRPTHLAAASLVFGTRDLFLSNETIDTTLLTIGGAPPPVGVIFDSAPPEAAGPELSVLHVHALTLSSGGTVRIVGARPLVVIASRDILIQGVVDGSAYRADEASQGPGPGGFAAGDGRGPGGGGNGPSPGAKPGGGGAGFGAFGGSGGNLVGPPEILGGSGGASYGDVDLTTLQGGSAGGSGGLSGCPTPGGGGGGAIQLSSATTIRIEGQGGINVGGAGGAHGEAPCGSGAGAGGGAGGALFLEAPSIVNLGTLAANGGGGGAASGGGSLPTAGRNGQFAIDPEKTGKGGLGAAPPCCGNGGNGGTTTTPPENGQPGNSTGGGGGGSAGRIRILRRTW